MRNKELFRVTAERLMKKYISAQAVITSPEISNVSRHWRESLRGESFSE